MSLNIVAEVLGVAIHEIGTVESGGANRGPRVEQYLAAAHAAPGLPWCAAFVAWCGIHSGVPWPLAPVPGCMSLYADAKAKGCISQTPETGAVFLLWFPKLNRFAHTGFIEKSGPTPGQWVTVEGNTNPGGGREGYGVFRRTRTFPASARFIHWWKAA